MMKLWDAIMRRSSNPRREHRFYTHRKHLLEAVNVKILGLEIGALDLPLIEQGEGLCEFADFRTTEELKILAEQIPGHDPNFVQPIAYDLRNGYSHIDKKFHWIAAAHVVEHVPDLIWWLNTLDSLLEEHGKIFLIVPDKRYTFDYHRRVTNLTDAVAAHNEKLQRPCYRQVFDHHYYSTPQLDPGSLWAGHAVGPAYLNYEAAHGCAARAEFGFEDAHCSVFTPDSFVSLMRDFEVSNLVKLKIADIRTTQSPLLDFSVVLSR